MAKNSILILEDANGLKIETTLQDVMRMVRVADLDDEEIELKDNQVPLTAPIVKSVVDMAGKEVDVTKLLDEVQKNKDKMPVALDILIEVTHSGDNTNSTSYRSDSMEKDSPSFLYPFKKPFLKNHDMYEEPIGRVKDSYFGQSEFTDRDTINCVFRVSDQDAMMKFLDGRYNTVSIGGSPKKVTCSICGKDILKDGQFKFCGHWRGEFYNNTKAIWTCTDIEYNEVSVVNRPADKWAQVKKITLVYPEDNQKKVGDSDMSNPVQDENIIGQILDEGGTPAPVTDPVPATDPTPVQDNNPQEPTPNQDPTPEPDAKDTEIAQLKVQVSDLTQEKTTLTDKVQTLENEKKDLNEKLVLSDAESKTAREQSLSIAMKYKSLLIERVKDLAGIAKEDVTDEVLGAMSIKELNDKVTDLKTKVAPPVHQSPTPVPNPGVVDNINDPNVVNDDEDKSTKKLTVSDYDRTETDIIKGMVK